MAPHDPAPAEASVASALATRPGARLRLSLAHLLVIGGSAAERLRIARLVHDESALRLGPFIALDCAREEPKLQNALSDWLGTAPAAHPLWSAERGSLFLDSIGEISQETQVQLLAFASRELSSVPAPERRGAARLMVGSDEDLWDLVAQGQFLAQLADVLDKIRVDLDVRLKKGTA